MLCAKMLPSLVLFCALCILINDAALAQRVITSKGVIVGDEVKTSDGETYATYFGVPYAKVDEDNPFENTLPYPRFTAPFNASDPNIMCPQVILREGGILQCLRLNIYVPRHNSHSNRPVFVWFHGGGLAFGSAGEYNATHLVQEDVIVITANYRLGPYGFLCTPDNKNQGLEDMKTALKWIKKEISAFGGDCHRITIAGESWGGSAVDYLLYEDAYFQQAIIQSGPRFSYAVSSREDTEVILKLAAILGQNTTDYRDALKYLAKSDPIQVMRAYNSLEYVFGVCEKPGDFHLDLNAKYAERIRNTPIMIGVTSKETFDDIASKPDSYYATVEDEFYKSLGSVFNLKNETLRNLTDEIWKFYLKSKPISKDVMLEIIDLSSDFQENYGTERSVTNFLKLHNPRVYKYVYSYIGESPYKNVSGVGAYHTQELPMLFEWWTKLKTEEEFMMRRRVVKLWMDFVKYGNPTPNPKSSPRWLATDLNSLRYFDINLQSQMKDQLYRERMTFWEQIWSKYGQYRK
nr:putative antennal esterase CXE2 [Ectropis grisescens]